MNEGWKVHKATKANGTHYINTPRIDYRDIRVIPYALSYSYAYLIISITPHPILDPELPVGWVV